METNNVTMFDEVAGWDEATGSAAPMQLRENVLREEVKEFLDAIDEDDIVEIADGACDVVWTVLLYCKGRGIPFDRIWHEVVVTNFNKIGPNGEVIRRESDGKILKPEGWQPPDVHGILKEAGLI